ncbi:DSBA oxidoreductase [Natronococcus amylolyticus DSM 10524]|uniref:DSBA oxidoreductase n=1 Tax=Natronococcus amylolyticus DSM 10524 TaxID=1227497 RepID=L9XEF4_9EURY|nr:thioredoxin domain-containing protein [Natronococcus amylolyticus]ELY60094.1 DSBA oxidoreductase [Natronococcus amylolyticus DSM 10524]
MNRRSFLTVTAATGSVALAGCSALFGASLPDELDGVDSDPDQLPTPTVGSGTVSIDVYEDLACPSCQEFQAAVFPELEARLLEDDGATYRHHDFPLPADEERSIPMANAARAVQSASGTEDDPGEFFGYKRFAMDAGTPSDEELVEIADAETDVDPSVVENALEENTYYPTLAAGWVDADDRGVDRTPTVFVDDEEVEDPLDADEIITMVEDTV